MKILLRSADQEIFHDELAISRCERLLADPAMDQSMREVGASFHAHDLVARPAAGANKLSRMVLSHLIHVRQSPTEVVDKKHPPNGVVSSRESSDG